MNPLQYSILDCVQTPVFVLAQTPAEEVIYQYVNEAVLELTELPFNAIVGQTAISVFDSGGGKQEYGRHVMAMYTNQPIVYEAHLAVNGKPLHMRTSLTPTPSVEGEVNTNLIIGTSHEVSVEYALRDAQSKSQKMIKEAEQFIALAAHDLQVPIRNFSSIVELLTDTIDNPSAEQTELVNLARTLSSSSKESIDDIIAYSTAASMATQYSEFNLMDVALHGLLVVDANGIAEHQICDKWLYGDQVATETVLRTLMKQSLRNNPDNPINIIIDVEPSSDDRYRITYQDNGIGYSAEELNQFERSDYILKGGYGLASIRRIIRERDGTLKLENADESGGRKATFSLPGHTLFYQHKMAC